MNLAETLVDHVLAVEWQALPDSTRRSTLTFLHDTLAVGVAGAQAAYAGAVAEVVRGWGVMDAGCGVLGRPALRLPATGAAFLNAFQIHAQEFDCVHEAAVVHPMTVVTAAVMAQAECCQVGGRELVAALVAGVDVAVGLGVAATTPIRFFRPATAGIFGAVAALCRLRRLSRQVSLDAFGYGLAFVSGTMQAHTEGKPALPLQMANAARGALAAVDLAVAGLPGPLASLDGPYGYLTMMEGGFDPARVLGAGYRMDEVSTKPFPSGRATHGAVGAVQALMRDHGVTADNLESLVYLAPPLIRHLCGRPMTPGLQFAQARLCIPFAAALVLTRGGVALCDFAPEVFADEKLLSLAARVTIEVDGNPDPAAFTPAVAIAKLRDGRQVRLEVTRLFGSPAWRLSREEHLEKARACLACGGWERVAGRLGDAIEGLESSEDSAGLFRLAQGAMG